MLLSLRVRRFLAILQEVQEARGTRVAMRYAARTVAGKFAMLRRHLGNMLFARDTGGHRTARPDEQAAEATVRVACALTGGIGDMIISARFLRDLAAAADAFQIDLYVPKPDLAAWIFAGIPGLDRITHDALFERDKDRHDVALRVSQMAIVYGESINWARLSANPRLRAAIETLMRNRPPIDLFVVAHPFLDNAFARRITSQGLRRSTCLQSLAGLPYGGDPFAIPSDAAIVQRLGLASRTYLTIHNGFDPDYIITGPRATKCYPFFEAVVAIVKCQRPDLVWVQVGSQNSERIAGCDHNLIGQTTLRQTAGLIARAALHIDNEGGLVHLARCFDVRSVVVFGPTPSRYFGYPSNINIDPPVCGDCWWTTRTWMDFCTQGYASPLCMTAQPPAAVAAQILSALADAAPTASAPDQR